MDTSEKAPPLTLAEQNLWVMRFERAQHARYEALWERAVQGAERPDQERMAKMVMQSAMMAAQDATFAVITLRALDESQISDVTRGMAAQMLKEIRGENLPTALPPLSDGIFPAPDYQLPPPGMMFPEGRTDAVHPVSEAPRPEDLVSLSAAWEEHKLREMPPGFMLQEDPSPSGSVDADWFVRLSLHPSHMEVAHCTDEAAARREAWALADVPHQIDFILRNRKAVDIETARSWTEAETLEAYRYLASVAVWHAAKPVPPESMYGFDATTYAKMALGE